MADLNHKIGHIHWNRRLYDSHREIEFNFTNEEYLIYVLYI